MTPAAPELIATVAQRLRAHYGQPSWEPDLSPVDGLIGTILSQHTSDINSERAFATLRQRFPSWETVRDAPVDAVANAIRVGGLANIKAARIQAVLTEITNRQGRIEVDHLADLPVPEAMAWLESLPGVGPKTAACVLLFNLGRPVLPVDTHVHRVATRLGLVPPRVSAERAQAILGETVPEQERYALHVNLIAHGRSICTAQIPRCSSCPLNDICWAFTTGQIRQYK